MSDRMAAAVWAEGRVEEEWRLIHERCADYGPMRAETAREAKAVIAMLMRGIGGVGFDTASAEEMPSAVAYSLEQIVRLAREVAVEHGWVAKREVIPPKLRTLIYRRDGYACTHCGTDDVTRLAIDHRIPVDLGGSNDPSNLRTLCKPCNSEKGARL